MATLADSDDWVEIQPEVEETSLIPSALTMGPTADEVTRAKVKADSHVRALESFMKKFGSMWRPLHDEKVKGNECFKDFSVEYKWNWALRRKLQQRMHSDMRLVLSEVKKKDC